MKGLLTFFTLLFTFQAYSQADTVSNWQIYLGNKLILSDNLASQSANGIKILEITKQDLAQSKTLIINFKNCTETKNKKVEIQFGNGSKRYTQEYFQSNNISLKTASIIELLRSFNTNKILFSINCPPFSQPQPRQSGIFLLELIIK